MWAGCQCFLLSLFALIPDSVVTFIENEAGSPLCVDRNLFNSKEIGGICDCEELPILYLVLSLSVCILKDFLKWELKVRELDLLLAMYHAMIHFVDLESVHIHLFSGFIYQITFVENRLFLYDCIYACGDLTWLAVLKYFSLCWFLADAHYVWIIIIEIK